MKIAIDGNVKIADEIISQIELWDAAVLGNKIDHLLDQCADDVNMFDVSIQLDGVDAYKKEWEKFSPYFSENVQIVRRNMKIYVSNDLAVLHCHSKVENAVLKERYRCHGAERHYALKRKEANG